MGKIRLELDVGTILLCSFIGFILYHFLSSIPA